MGDNQVIELLNNKGKRLLALSEALKTGGTIPTLAVMAGATVRQTYRDIVYLRGMGMNIRKIKPGVYKLMACLLLLTSCSAYHDVTHSEGYGRWKQDQQSNLKHFGPK